MTPGMERVVLADFQQLMQLVCISCSLETLVFHLSQCPGPIETEGFMLVIDDDYVHPRQCLLYQDQERGS